MIKILRNKNNKDNSLIELNLFDNPFYFLHNNKQCEHFSTYIEDFKDAICRFCKNLPLIKVNPEEIKEVNKSFKIQNKKKIFSWTIPINEDGIIYTLYKVDFTQEIAEYLSLLFIKMCGDNINDKDVDDFKKILNHDLLIITATEKENKKKRQIIGFSIYENNFSRINIKNNKYKEEDLNKFIDIIIDKEYGKDQFFSIIIKSITKVNNLENFLLQDKTDEIDSLFNKYYSKFSHIYNILNYVEIFKKKSYPQIYINFHCISERYKNNIGNPFFYFFQNEIKNRIKDSESIEGYIGIRTSLKNEEFYNKIGFNPYYIVNKFYKNVNDLINMGILKEKSNKIFMVSINLAEEDLKIGNFEDLIINE